MTASSRNSLPLALRVPTVALVSGLFAYFVARYASLRGEWLRTERQLNMTSRGRLAVTRLGTQVLRESVRASPVASGSTFFGFARAVLALPLLRCPGASAIAALSILEILSFGLARAVDASRWRCRLRRSVGWG